MCPMLRDAIVEYFDTHLNATVNDVARRFNVDRATVLAALRG